MTLRGKEADTLHGQSRAKRILTALAAGLMLTGCVYEKEPAPRVVSGPTPGARATDCSGAGFPLAELLARLETRTAGPISPAGRPPAGPWEAGNGLR